MKSPAFVLLSLFCIGSLSGCSMVSGLWGGSESSEVSQNAAPQVKSETAAEPNDVTADAQAAGVRAPREAFVGEWIAPVPGQPKRTQGYVFRADGSASSIGMATLRAKRWAVKDEYLTIWGDSVGNGMTIPFEMQYLVLEASPEVLHIQQGGYEATFTRRK